MPSFSHEPIDSRQLQNFVSLARTGSYSQTARELNLTQSAISHSIKKLETNLDRKLFDRQGNSFRLNESGEMLLREASEILQRMTGVRERLLQQNEWGYGRLRVACSTTFCEFLLPPVLREFRQSFPSSTISIRSGDGPSCLKLLRDGEVDLAMMLEPLESAKEVVFESLFKDVLKLVIAPFHPWSENEEIQADSLCNEPFLVHSHQSYTSFLLNSSMRRNGIHLGQFIEMGSHEAIKEMVKIGIGVTTMPEWSIQRELDQGTLISRDLPRVSIERTWGYCKLRTHQLSLHEETFIGLCHEAKAQVDRSNIQVFA